MGSEMCIRDSAYPVLSIKEYNEVRVVEILSASAPAILFNPKVFKKEFGLGNVLNYLWCDVALLVGTKQHLWEKHHSIVPLKIWNCFEPVVRGHMYALKLKAGMIKENAELLTCVY